MKRSQTTIKEIDIHMMTTMQAKSHLLQIFNQLEPNINEIVIIHGFNNGTALKEMVLTEFKHPRIKSKHPALNSGRTRIFVK